MLTCIEDNLKRRILLPYLTAHFWWMEHDDEPMCNWTVWCTQNVLLTTFLMPWSEEMSSKLAAPVRAFTGDAPLFLPENTYYRRFYIKLLKAVIIFSRITATTVAVRRVPSITAMQGCASTVP